MNAENFAQYLKNPSQLYQISYQELKSLVLQYPYCLNLHYLLLLKSKMDQHKDLNPNLEKTAAYSINRKFLYKQLKAQEQDVAEAESFTINEDFLELKDLSIIEEPASNGETSDSLSMEVPIPDASPFREAPATSNSALPILEVPDLEDEENIAIENEVLAELESLKAAAQSKEQEEKAEQVSVLHEEAFSLDLSTSTELEPQQEEMPVIVEEAPTTELAVPEVEENETPMVTETSDPLRAKEKKKKKKHVNGKPTFTSWVEQFQSDLQTAQMSEIMEAKKREEAKRLKKLKKKAEALKQQKKKKKKSKKTKVSLIAQNSIQDNNSIASETLAKLLVAQEQYTRAIRIYERLLLQEPENKAYPAEINRIRTLIEA